MFRGKRIGRLVLGVALMAMSASAVQTAQAGPATGPATTPESSRTAESSRPEQPGPPGPHGPHGPHGSPAIPLEDLTVATTQVAAGLERPIAVVTPDDGSGRLFVAEKTGAVRVYHPDTGLAEEPLINLADEVDYSGNERGLLGLEVAPDFAESRTLYVAYTRASDSAVTLSRVELGEDGSQEPVEPQELFTQEHSEYSNHNGGHITFGPDGHLYMGIGDGGGSGDPFRSGQSLDTLLGKILRVDVSRSCGELPYCIPRDNPFVHTAGARGEIWAYGLRNPWQFSLDTADGSLWIGDVGQGTTEEVDHLAPNRGGTNFGWSCKEGLDIFDETHCSPGAVLTDPVFTYRSSVEGCSVIGGQVYHGKEDAELADGTYVFTDYCSSTVWAMRANPDGTYEDAVIGEFPTQVTTIGTDADGEFYVVNDLPGGLHRVSFEEK